MQVRKTIRNGSGAWTRTRIARSKDGMRPLSIHGLSVFSRTYFALRSTAFHMIW